MNLGELKLECLRIIQPDMVLTNDLENYEQDENYTMILNNVIGSVNRALQIVASRGKFPIKTLYITSETEVDPSTSQTSKFNKYNIMGSTNIVNDFFKLISVRYVDSHDYHYTTEFRLEYPFLLLLKIGSNERYAIKYEPLPQISPSTSNETDLLSLGIPVTIQNILPYFVKGDLTESEDANKALLARNTFDAYLNDTTAEQTISESSSVEDVYKF